MLFEIRESHINKCSYKKKNTKYSVSECVDITVTIFANKSMDCQVCKRIKSLTLARNFLRTSMYNDFHTTYQLLTNHGIQGLSKFSIFLINSCLGFVIPDFRSRSAPVLCKCILTFVCLFPQEIFNRKSLFTKTSMFIHLYKW